MKTIKVDLEVWKRLMDIKTSKCKKSINAVIKERFGI